MGRLPRRGQRPRAALPFPHRGRRRPGGDRRGRVVPGQRVPKRGFVRLLGSGHVLMIPMLVWFVFWRIDAVSLPEDRLFYNWLWLVIVTDTICVVVDIVEVTRYLKGDSEPSYIW